MISGLSEFFVRTLTKGMGKNIIIVEQPKANLKFENLGHVRENT
jgi:hypothetical protein